jgi:hypothetical protein
MGHVILAGVTRGSLACSCARCTEELRQLAVAIHGRASSGWLPAGTRRLRWDQEARSADADR